MSTPRPFSLATTTPPAVTTDTPRSVWNLAFRLFVVCAWCANEEWIDSRRSWSGTASNVSSDSIRAPKASRKSSSPYPSKRPSANPASHIAQCVSAVHRSIANAMAVRQAKASAAEDATKIFVCWKSTGRGPPVKEAYFKSAADLARASLGNCGAGEGMESAVSMKSILMLKSGPTSTAVNAESRREPLGSPNSSVCSGRRNQCSADSVKTTKRRCGAP
mmetsp:Transcript_12410/g.44006  ORF Transcript_12410/g.44006 Transcript_12410/m.44006 type:complete len:219 (-) Transcript_12410:292-948(-)